MHTEVEAFLQRIRAFPDDDAPRLIFADWLEEQTVDPAPARPGHAVPREWSAARGQFIRVQIALARLLEEADEEAAPPRRYERDESQSEFLQLERKEQQLLSIHEPDWVAPFHGLATGHRFRRGFVEEVQVEALTLLRHGGELFEAGPLRHIRLHDIGECLPALFQCHLLSRLAALTIHASYKGEALARTLARSEHLAGLTTLQLTRAALPDEGVHHLAVSPQLSRLEELDLGENDLGETAAEILAASPTLVGLKRLKLRHNRLGAAGAEAIAGSERFERLDRLDLEGNQIGGGRVQSLTRTRGFFRVPSLSLAGNDLRAAALQHLLQHGGEPIEPEAIRLRRLDLSSNPLADNGMRVLAACPRLENLRVLRLEKCLIGDEGLRALAGSPYLNNLVVLDLSNNPPIGVAGCRALLESKQLRELRRPILSPIGMSADMHKRLHERFPER